MGTPKRARQKELSRTRAEQARRAEASAAKRRRFVNVVVALIAVAMLATLIVVWTGDGTTDTADDTTSTTADAGTAPETTAPAVTEGTAPCPEPDGSSEQQRSFDGPPRMCIDPAATYTAEIETNKGTFTVQLDAERAPLTVNNFVFLARYHFFDGIIFHRIIEGFVIQGGDPEGTGTGGPGYEFPDELPQEGEYEKYSLAMANSGPDTNGSQFFVITGDQGVALPPNYSLFGKAIDGFDVIDEIATVPTGDGDRPVDEVRMEKVTITES